jgi:hypothetical protein
MTTDNLVETDESLLSPPQQHNSLQRIQNHYVNLESFTVTQAHTKQYSGLYYTRLSTIRPLLLPKCEEMWSEGCAF